MISDKIKAPYYILHKTRKDADFGLDKQDKNSIIGINGLEKYFLKKD